MIPMKSFIKPKKIVFYSNDYNGIDLNYKSNLIKKCKSYNFQPIIILTNIIKQLLYIYFSFKYIYLKNI